MVGKIACFISAFAAAASVADVVEFKSGAKLGGTFKNVAGGTVTFVSDDVGEVKIPAEKIAKLVTEKPNVLEYADKTRESAVLGLADGTWTKNGAPFDLAAVKAVNPVEETWHGSVNLTASAARGNTVSENAVLLAEVNRRWERDRFSANGGYYFAQSGDSKETKRKSEDRILLAAQEDHFWVNKVYSYVNGKYETDRINDLDHRYRLGAGLGYQWLDGDEFEWTGKWSFNQEVGAEYVAEKWEHPDPDADENYASFRYAHHLKFIPNVAKQLEWFHNLEYHPNVADWEEVYVINADVGFTTVVWAGWDLLMKVEWDYNSAPAAHAKNSDLRYIAGLGYKW